MDEGRAACSSSKTIYPLRLQEQEGGVVATTTRNKLPRKKAGAAAAAVAGRAKDGPLLSQQASRDLRLGPNKVVVVGLLGGSLHGKARLLGVLADAALPQVPPSLFACAAPSPPCRLSAHTCAARAVRAVRCVCDRCLAWRTTGDRTAGATKTSRATYVATDAAALFDVLRWWDSRHTAHTHGTRHARSVG
jgi:hypothetical protein